MGTTASAKQQSVTIEKERGRKSKVEVAAEAAAVMVSSNDYIPPKYTSKAKF
jgi:hypothetical protein